MVEEFVTSRLAMRPLTQNDLNIVVELNSDCSVMEYITGRASSVEESEEEVRAAIGGRWLVFDRSGNEFLGWVSASQIDNRGEFELGWRFRRAAWGHGYATEASAALLERVFVEGARRVFAETMAVNKPSRAVMQRLGLRYVRTFHLDFDDPLPGTEFGEVEYELTRETWERRSV